MPRDLWPRWISGRDFQGVQYPERLFCRLPDAVGIGGSIQPDQGQGDGGTAVCFEHARPSTDLVVPLHRPHYLGVGEVVEASVGALTA
jgi:hypothetical protein